jgi:hypothetical protein
MKKNAYSVSIQKSTLCADMFSDKIIIYIWYGVTVLILCEEYKNHWKFLLKYNKNILWCLEFW